MPNIFDANGLQIETYEETKARIEAQFRSIYGTDIDLSTNTPDGQNVAIQTQNVQDVLQLLLQVNSSMDPDQAVGVILDQRVAINGIERNDASYTITPIEVITTQVSTNLYGLDQTDFPPFTISDDSDTRWVLASSQLGVAAGTYSFTFRALEPGQVFPVPNTITTMVTVVLGVSVNNPFPYTYLGTKEESDGALKIRRKQSVSIGGRQWLDGLESALRNMTGMVAAKVFQNRTNTPVNGIPAHGIWAITEGSASQALIANAIFNYLTAGAAMRGDTTYTIFRNGSEPEEIAWDEARSQPLFFVAPLDWIEINSQVPNLEYIRDQLAERVSYNIYDKADSTSLGTIIQEIEPNLAIVRTAGWPWGASSIYPNFYGLTNVRTQRISALGSTDPASGSYRLNYGGAQTTLINWDDNEATVTGKLAAIVPLVYLTLQSAPYRLTFQLDVPVNEIEGLVTVSDNTMEDGSSAFAFIRPILDLSATLEPFAPVNKWVLLRENIIFNLIMTPSAIEVPSGTVVSFKAIGGYGDYFFTISVDDSGGNINSNTGVYTAGAGTGTDEIRCYDGSGQIAYAYVTVV